MSLKIYSKEDTLRLEVSPSDNSTQQCAMLGGSVNLTFTTYEFARLDIKDYIDVYGQRYWLKKAYSPTLKSESEYEYNVIFYDQSAFTQDAVVLKLVDGEDSPEFALDDTPAVHLQLIVDNINRVMGTGLYVVGEVITGDRKNVEYNKTYCLDALNNLAELYETECWIEGYTVNLSRAEHGSPITLAYRAGLINLSVKDNETAKFYTRLIPLGSKRNIDASHYGHTRLQLPDGVKWLEKNLEYGIKEHVEEEAFSGIYPRYTGTITSVRAEEVTIDNVLRTIYYIKDSGLLFNPNNYEIAGLVKQLTFQSGELNGRDFEANWHADTGEWEIINQYPYENQQLPGGAMIPKVGDKYIPWNFRMPDEYYPAAELEFYDAVEALLQKNSIDTAIYAGDSDYIYFDEENINVSIGRRITLLSSLYFETGARNSRIIAFHRNLNNPTQYYLEFSDSTSVGRLDTIEGDVKSIKAAVFATPDTTELTIIRTWDNRDLTDYNVLSSLRSVKEIEKRALSRLTDDVAAGTISFEKNIKSAIFFPGMDGSGWQITAAGDAILEAARIRDSLYVGGVVGSESFASGFAGFGTQINIPDSSITSDFLTVRKSMKVYELVYSQIYGLGGSVMITDLNKILTVEDKGGYYTVVIDKMEDSMRMNLRTGDIVRMQKSSGINIRYFYGEILLVTTDYFNLQIIDGEDIPEPGDVVFRMGNKTDLTRQGVIYLTSSDDKAPYIDVLDGITDSSMFEKVKVRIGNLAGITTKHGRQLTKYGIYGVNAVFEDSDIYLSDGTTVEQQFTIMDGKLESEIQSIRNDMSMEYGNILRNSTFSNNSYYWHSTDDISILNVGGNLLWFNANFYADKRAVADIYRDDNRQVLRILNTKIVQNEQDYTIEGEATEGTYSYSFFYKVLRPGILKVGIPGTDLYSELALNSTTAGYEKFTKAAEWDTTGNFEIGFTGELLVYGVSLFEDSLAGSLVRMQTQILQNNEEIALRATKQYVDSETGRIENEWASELSVTAAQIEASVKAWTNGQLTNYSTISQTSNQIQAAVNNLNLSQYATTTWTSSQITSAVSSKTTWGEVKSKLTQTAEDFTIAVAHISDDVKGITEAFYKFDSSRMYVNRRIEVGSGTTANFIASAGISPKDSNNIAFWAGGTFDQAVSSVAAVRINHTGDGYLAKGNMSWTQAGDITIRGRFESNAEGKRVFIDPSQRKLQMIASDKVVVDIGFQSQYNKGADVRYYLYNESDTLISGSVFGGGNISLFKNDYDYFMKVLHSDTQTIFELHNLPTSRAAAYYGCLYLDGETVKRRNS